MSTSLSPILSARSAPRRAAPALGLLLALAACASEEPDETPGPAPATKIATLRYAMTPFTLQPGEEQIYCQFFPPDGKAHLVNRFTAELSRGSHHLVVFRISHPMPDTPTEPVPCSQLDLPGGFDGLLPGAQQQHTEVSLPAGVVMKLEPHHGLLFQQHYINATTAPLTTDVTWAADEVAETPDQQRAGMLFYSNFRLSVPPGTSEATSRCAAPADVNLVTATGHMHRRGVTFDASVAGQALYHADSWDDPPNLILPGTGLPVRQGDEIRWTCAYDNPTDQTLHFGNSALTNEMCIFVSLFYPSPSGATDFLCRQPS